MSNISYNFQITEDQLIFYRPSHIESPMEDTFTVTMMIVAWFLLIVGFSICFCNQCTRRGIWLFQLPCCCGIVGVLSEQGDGDADSITTTYEATIRGKKKRV